MIIISSGATGMLMSLVWYAFCKIAKNYLHTKVINFSLKIVLISYYIPSMFVALMIRDKVFELQNIIILYLNDIVKISLTVFFTVTIILFIREIKKVYDSYKELGEHCQNRYPADVDIAAKKEELSRKFKVRRDVKIYRCIDITDPFTYGVIRPTIYLPDNDIEDEYLRVLLTHELFHNKQWDFIWKPLSIFVSLVMDKQDECINIGILQSDGVIRYISCMENYDYIFKNMKSDLYKIFIFNGSDEEAIFRITYGY